VIDTQKLQVVPANAPKFIEWLKTRGGLAVWGCLDLGDAGRTWTTPFLQADGSPTPKPHWSASDAPIRHVTDASEVEVCVDVEVKRFRVGLKRGSGLTVNVTDAATRKIREAVAKAGDGAYYGFDYGTQEAVILKPDTVVPLSEWKPSPEST
jgi:hypothetical protein